MQLFMKVIFDLVKNYSAKLKIKKIPKNCENQNHTMLHVLQTNIVPRQKILNCYIDYRIKG